jgi:hypothetical protein
MKLPNKVKIASHTVTVHKNVDSEEAGWWSTRDNSMFVNQNYPHSQQVTTFLHETLHALNYGLDHKEVEWIAQGIAQVIIENKINLLEE